MADGVQINAGNGPKIAAREVPYSGETQQVQVVGIATFEGPDDAKTPTDVGPNNPFPVEASGVNQMLLLLSQIVSLLESNSIVDSAQRQRITVDAISTGLTLSAISTVSTVNAVSTVSTVNAVSALPNLPTIAGMDREMYINIAEQSYALNILPFLKFG